MREPPSSLLGSLEWITASLSDHLGSYRQRLAFQEISLAVYASPPVLYPEVFLGFVEGYYV